jgi:hypothetical protein
MYLFNLKTRSETTIFFSFTQGPIIPDYLYRIEHPEHNCSQQHNKMAMSDIPCSIIITDNTSASTIHQLQTMKESSRVQQTLIEVRYYFRKTFC